jgi:hypothetical protein
MKEIKKRSGCTLLLRGGEREREREREREGDDYLLFLICVILLTLF